VTGRPESGFTLLEMLVVLMVLALGTALVMVSSRQGPAQQLKAECSRLASWLEAARAQARAQGLPVQALVDAGGVTVSGLPKESFPNDRLNWLQASTRAEAGLWVLGPEPILPPQSIGLSAQSESGAAAATTEQAVTSGLEPWECRP
jgi:general secretion pathway protein H